MGKGKKVTKKVVGSANGRAARGEEADAATKEFAAAGMGLQEPTAAAAEGSGGEGMAPGDAGPPALSTLDDAVPRPAEADPSSGGGGAGGSEPAAAMLTIEQRGAATRAAFKELDAGERWLAAGDAAQPAAAVPGGGAGPEGAGGQTRTGLGVGSGVFDVTYTPEENAMPLTRFGGTYAKESDWSPRVAQHWEEMLAKLRADWAGNGVTVRLFKVAWQGRELSREAIVGVLEQVLKPIGEVVGDLAVCSELFDNKGVRANGGEEVLGYGGGIYVPVVMRDLSIPHSPEQEAGYLSLWGGVKPGVSEEPTPGSAAKLWDCPPGYFTVGVPVMQTDRTMVVHNLCIQMSWWTLESLQEPERLGCLKGDWFVEGVDVRKREEVQMVRLMAGLGQMGKGEMQGIKLQLRPEWVEGEKLQMIWGVAPADRPRLTSQVAYKLPYGVEIEWKGEQRLLQTGKPDLLVAEKEQWRQSGRAAGGYRQERVDTDPRKLVIKPLAKHLQGQMWADKLQELIEGCDGVEGVESVGFSPDRHPGFRRRGVVAFVVFSTVEQRDAALVDNRVAWALLGTEFQLENKMISIEAKDPERNTALDRREAGLVGGGKRPRKEVVALPRPLGSVVAGGAQGRGWGGGSRGQGVTIADEQGKAMDRGGEEAIREMEKLANDQLVEQLGRQMKELFSGLAQKQEEENRRLMEENLAIRKRMEELEQEKLRQNSRMEQVMTAMLQQLQQMGGGQPWGGQPASAEVTPARPSKPAVVMPEMPSTQEKQVRTGVLIQQGGAGLNSTQEQEGELAVLRTRSREMEAALRDVMTEGEGAGMLARLLEAKGHGGVVGMITSGGVLPPGAQ